MKTSVVSVNGIEISCQLALTPEEHSTGLQKHASLDDGEGMLFLFEPPRSATFHMGKVAFPIDLVGVDGECRVSRIVEAAQPRSLARWTFSRVAAVLEVPAFWCRKNAIKQGAPVELLTEKTASVQEVGWLDPKNIFHPLEGGLQSHYGWAVKHSKELGLTVSNELDTQYLLLDLFDRGWIRVLEVGVETSEATMRRRIQDVRRVLAGIARRGEGTIYATIAPEEACESVDIRIPVSASGRPDFTNLNAFMQGKVAKVAIRSTSKTAELGSEDGMVSPDGEFYAANGSHPNWAHDNYQRFGIDFVPVMSIDHEPLEPYHPDAVFDSEGQMALDYFLQAGWIRIKGSRGIEVYGIDKQNALLVQRILRVLAKNRPGDAIYIDGLGTSATVPVDVRGRPDLSVLKKHVHASMQVTAIRHPDDGMVDPQGGWHPVGPEGHWAWAWSNLEKFRMPRPNPDVYGPESMGGDAWDPQEDGGALMQFLYEGWLRIAGEGGVQVSARNVRSSIAQIKTALRNLAKNLSATSLWVDATDDRGEPDTILVPVTPTGRLDFSKLDRYVKTGKVADAINEDYAGVRGLRQREKDRDSQTQQDSHMIPADLFEAHDIDSPNFEQNIGYSPVNDPGVTDQSRSPEIGRAHV